MIHYLVRQIALLTVYSDEGPRAQDQMRPLTRFGPGDQEPTTHATFKKETMT
jgi:hypothetical protein